MATAYGFLERPIAALVHDQPVTLVLRDWGSALGFHWARRRPDQAHAIAYMEALVTPRASREDRPEQARGMFQGFRSPKGDDPILKRNLFIEAVLPSSAQRRLTDGEMAT